MGMDLTKEFVNSCRKVGVLRDFLCQAIDQVDEKDKEIAKLKEQYKDMDVTHTVHIAKMNARIEELDESLESEKASRYADSVDAGMRERRLKRALWLSRAELCCRLDVDRYLRKHINSWYNENCLTWDEACVAMEVKMCKAESKCRAKAEEYK